MTTIRPIDKPIHSFILLMLFASMFDFLMAYEWVYFFTYTFLDFEKCFLPTRLLRTAHSIIENKNLALAPWIGNYPSFKGNWLLKASSFHQMTNIQKVAGKTISYYFL